MPALHEAGQKDTILRIISGKTLSQLHGGDLMTHNGLPYFCFFKDKHLNVPNMGCLPKKKLHQTRIKQRMCPTFYVS